MGQYIQLVAVFAAARLRQGYGTAKTGFLRTSLHLNDGVKAVIPSSCPRRSFSARQPLMVAAAGGLRHDA
ncbi:hypothetical protein BTJ39_11855 [Izhakiella australiensis]|uniref:Uncharacterized protein n=1 Tax=Izhakiella australiensis TaxID=1926881 RepID=A0A1S8YLG6_9GAMM|nr:hypothetical protein BTJ39_11855 [Izhakiella australiensis]